MARSLSTDRSSSSSPLAPGSHGTLPGRTRNASGRRFVLADHGAGDRCDRSARPHAPRPEGRGFCPCLPAAIPPGASPMAQLLRRFTTFKGCADGHHPGFPERLPLADPLPDSLGRLYGQYPGLTTGKRPNESGRANCFTWVFTWRATRHNRQTKLIKQRPPDLVFVKRFARRDTRLAMAAQSEIHIDVSGSAG
jgi:hypothetical protein